MSAGLCIHTGKINRQAIEKQYKEGIYTATKRPVSMLLIFISMWGTCVHFWVEVHLQVCACVCMHAHVSVCLWRAKVTSCVFLHLSPPYYVQSLLENLEFTASAGLASQ